MLLVGLEFFAKFLITFLGSLAYLHNYFKDLEQARFDGPAAGGDRLAENGPCNEQLETAVQDYYTESGSESGSDAEGDKYVRGRRFARGVDLKLVRSPKISYLCKVVLFSFQVRNLRRDTNRLGGAIDDITRCRFFDAWVTKANSFEEFDDRYTERLRRSFYQNRNVNSSFAHCEDNTEPATV